MISKIEKLDILLNVKKDFNKHYLYSQILKNERTKRRLTLSEMAKGICSISYLCKFERNSIVADENYIRAIFERVNLDYNKVGLNIIEDGVKNIIKAYLNNHYTEIEKIYEMIDDTLFNAQNYLIKGFYFLIKEKYIEFKEIIATIDNIKETLMKEDIGVFMFLVIEYYIKTHQFSEAYKYLKYLEPMNFDFDELNWLIYEQQMVVGYNLKKYPLVYSFYNKLMGNYNIGYPSKRQLIIRLMLLDFQAHEYFSNVINEVNHLEIDEKDYFYYDLIYWKSLIMLKGGMWTDVYDILIEKNLTFDVRFIGLLLYTVDLINKEEYIKKAVEIATNYDFKENDTIHQKFVRFMLIKFGSEKKYSLIEYLRFNIIPYNGTYTHHLYSDVYEKHYVEYLCKTSKYKEALSFYKK